MGLPLIAADMDLSIGGMYHYGLRGTDGQEIWGKWVFQEITAPRSIVFVVSFSDRLGSTTRHPFLRTWPLEECATVDLTESNGRTTMRFRLKPISAQPAEIQSFEDRHDTLELVWGQMFDGLRAYLVALTSSSGS